MQTAAPHIGATELAKVPYRVATDAILHALRGGLDPAAALQRSILDVARGQLLLMPAETADFVAVKIVTVAPDNPSRGLPRIVGTMLLIDGETLVPVATLDGAAVTTLRTPAVSAAGAVLLGRSHADGPRRLVVFGSGPQAMGHVRALGDVMDIAHVTLVGRDAGRAAAAAALIAEATSAAVDVGAPDAVRGADVIVCATSATAPLFDAADIADGALVIAVGSHERGVVEFDPRLLARAQTAVEEVGVARRESGEVIAATEAGLVTGDELVPMAALARGEVEPRREQVQIFKSSGMGWEDAVVAAAVWRSRGSGGPGAGRGMGD